MAKKKSKPVDEFPNAIIGFAFWKRDGGTVFANRVASVHDVDFERNEQEFARVIARLIWQSVEQYPDAKFPKDEPKGKRLSVMIEVLGEVECWVGFVDGRKLLFGTIADVTPEEAQLKYEAALRGESLEIRTNVAKVISQIQSIDELPEWIKTTVFAQHYGVSVRTVLRMISTNQVSHRIMNLDAKRPTYQLKTSDLRTLLGLDVKKRAPTPPVYKSKLLAGLI